MRNLLAATCLTPVALCAFALPLHAETVVGDARTVPLRTATINGGNADDIRISTAGSVKPAAGAAVTIDTNNSVNNQGTIQITGANDSTGILANAGTAGTITNSGKIILDENFTATDTDTDGDLDGTFAQGARRYGIRVGSGGTFTGNIVNSGEITVEGNDSAGIRLDSNLAGSLTSSGKIDVLGNDSQGIRVGNITGNVGLTGTISARGANSVGVALDGDIGGALTVQGTILATGYRSTTAPADASKLDADDLLQGGPALRVSGDVAGGILFDAPPANNSTTDDDEDDDGIKDADETVATVRAFGAAPAVQIGSATSDVTIGAVAGNAAGHGIVVKGEISGNGVYSGITGNGLVIGGLGGNVNVAGGLTVSGLIGAQASNAGATAIRIGSGATVPAIVNSGQIAAAGGSGTNPAVVRAILVEQGAGVGTINNSGQITAVAGGTQGSAGAIVDLSGGLTLVENSGSIVATSAQTAPESAVAIDLRTNSTGAVVRQTAAATGRPPSQIVGSILFGSGNDLLDVAAGSVNGTTRFGAGADRLNLAGSSIYTGTVDFGGGADTLALTGASRLTGTLAGSSGLAVSVNGGTLDLTNTGTVALSSLAVAGQGAIRVNVDSAAGTNTLYDVAGTASFAAGSKLIVNVTDTAGAVGDHLVVSAGTLTGGANLGLQSAALPFLYSGTLTASDASGEISLNIRRKSASELGLNRSESSAYDAIYAALSEDAGIEGVFLGVTAADDFRSIMQEMLPDHAGGAFETVTQSSRATARFLTDPHPPMVDMGGWGFFLQQVAWGTSTDLVDTAAYDVSGWGATGGAEFGAGNLGAFGLTLSYLLGADANGSNSNEVNAKQFELAGYWRGEWNGIHAFARASGARIDFDSVRNFTGTTVDRETRGGWNGTLWSAGAGISYELHTGRLTVRPLAAVDYYSLKEDGYSETGGGAGFDLIVDKRSSDEMAANGTVTLGYDLGGVDPTSSFFRVELEGGRREILGGTLGATTAHFEGGDDFVLVPDQRSSGWLGRLRLLGGSESFRLGAEVGAEERDGDAALSARVSLRTGF